MKTIGPFNNTPAEIWGEARRAGLQAANDCKDEWKFDCGFAWVNINPARGPFVNYLRSAGVGSKAYGDGWQIWYNEFSTNTQTMPVHEAAARAVVDVLRKHGINASYGSRLD